MNISETIVLKSGGKRTGTIGYSLFKNQKRKEQFLHIQKFSDFRLPIFWLGDVDIVGMFCLVDLGNKFDDGGSMFFPFRVAIDQQSMEVYMSIWLIL